MSNRLLGETSPYLLQHARNPVDWFPWGSEALELARREDKLIFLSIGYAACHWCHVMEHESFEDSAVAEALNRDFVSIKVDREERPDLDEIYMAATMLYSGGHGGWPMSVFLAPDLRPVFAGTYFPKEDAYGRPGFKTVLRFLQEKWKRDRSGLLNNAGKVVDAVRRMHVPSGRSALPVPISLPKRPRRSTGPSTTLGAASPAAATSSRRACPWNYSCARPGPRVRSGSGRPSSSLWNGSAWAGSTITWEAACTVTLPIPTGSCRTLRRCSTIRRW